MWRRKLVNLPVFLSSGSKGYQKGDKILALYSSPCRDDWSTSQYRIDQDRDYYDPPNRDKGRITKKHPADPMGPGKLVVLSNAVEDNFMAVPSTVSVKRMLSSIVGVSGPGVVQRAIEKVPGANLMYWRNSQEDSLQDYPCWSN